MILHKLLMVTVVILYQPERVGRHLSIQSVGEHINQLQLTAKKVITHVSAGRQLLLKLRLMLMITKSVTSCNEQSKSRTDNFNISITHRTMGSPKGAAITRLLVTSSLLQKKQTSY